MKMFTKDEVTEKIKEFNEYMMQEKTLQEELLNLQIQGSRDATIAASRRHDEIIAQIDDLRMNKMMPILEEMAAFVAHCEKLEKAEQEETGGK